MTLDQTWAKPRNPLAARSLGAEGTEKLSVSRQLSRSAGQPLPSAPQCSASEHRGAAAYEVSPAPWLALPSLLPFAQSLGAVQPGCVPTPNGQSSEASAT